MELNVKIYIDSSRCLPMITSSHLLILPATENTCAISSKNLFMKEWF